MREIVDSIRWYADENEIFWVSCYFDFSYQSNIVVSDGQCGLFIKDGEFSEPLFEGEHLLGESQDRHVRMCFLPGDKPKTVRGRVCFFNLHGKFPYSDDGEEICIEYAISDPKKLIQYMQKNDILDPTAWKDFLFNYLDSLQLAACDSKELSEKLQDFHELTGVALFVLKEQI